MEEECLNGSLKCHQGSRVVCGIETLMGIVWTGVTISPSPLPILLGELGQAPMEICSGTFIMIVQDLQACMQPIGRIPSQKVRGVTIREARSERACKPVSGLS
ncbi:hypothetical protein NQZ68_017577 [Dissostichus eleginoides]|nr:hypothetical protein NQZ68_017577 [Dissostichus eleginoides]